MRSHCTPEPFSVDSIVVLVWTRLRALSAGAHFASSLGVEMISCVPVADV